MSKMSIRFYNDHEVRAVWDDNDPRWCTIDDRIKKLIEGALTDKIYDRDVFMKGIDYSYYYEEE